MKKRPFILFCFLSFIVLSIQLWPQFTPEELAERPKWEEFLRTAKIIKSEQPYDKREAVTRPWRLTLEKDGTVINALWKDAKGRMHGAIENWYWEIAAYRLDKYLGVNMVPPTIEKRFENKIGSCQMFAGAMDLEEKVKNKVKTPSYRIFHLNRAYYIQRAFDNLIANNDRHQSNFRLTEDFRLILIDHSRTFLTSKKFTTMLIYDENNRENPTFIMKELPRAFVEKLKTLNHDIIRDAVGEYLTDKEIECVLIRRDLITAWLDNRIKGLGEDKVLY